MVNDERSIGSHGFNLTTGQSINQNFSHNPSKVSIDQCNSQASINFNLSQSASVMGQTVIKNPNYL